MDTELMVAYGMLVFAALLLLWGLVVEIREYRIDERSVTGNG